MNFIHRVQRDKKRRKGKGSVPEENTFAVKFPEPCSTSLTRSCTKSDPPSEEDPTARAGHSRDYYYYYHYKRSQNRSHVINRTVI